MSDDLATRLSVPEQADKGETITIRALIAHPMESGLGKDDNGKTIARRLINRFTVEFNQQAIFNVKLGPGIAANPYFEVDYTVEESGEFVFKWFDDNGEIYQKKRVIQVS